MNNEGSVNLSISKEIVNPIVDAKIKAAIIDAMGGSDALIAKVMDSIINQPVNHEGKISGYSSDNKFKWLDVVITEQLKQAVKDSLTEILRERQSMVKAAIMKQLSSKKGLEAFAEALIGSVRIEDKYSTKISVEFSAKN